MRTKGTWLAVVALLVLGPSPACNGDDDDELRVIVTAAIVEVGAPATVEATDVTASERGTLMHNVRVTWRGQEQAFLDDARFTHHEANGGDLVLAGRGCGAEWDATLRHVTHPCTADLQIVRLEPDESHAYPVWIFPEVGPLALKPGTYVVDQPIPYWGGGPQVQVPDYDRPEGEFTIRLTYEVR
ncbi:MAG: hypothetical protein IT302_08650 [Dehalococcoidia bacterium]|nr:hypothetical protein [Dehalococcoidia bacterium]